MILSGDHVRILEGFYKGELAIIKQKKLSDFN